MPHIYGCVLMNLVVVSKHAALVRLKSLGKRRVMVTHCEVTTGVFQIAATMWYACNARKVEAPKFLCDRRLGHGETTLLVV